MSFLARRYLRLLQTHTLATQMATAGIVFPLGDTIAQHFIEDRPWMDHNYSRTIRFVSYGALAWAPIAYRWHRILNSISLSTPFRTISSRVTIDMCIFAPFATGYFFTIMGFLQGRNWKEIKSHLDKSFSQVTLTNVCVFGPAQVINMSLLPVYARPPFLNLVSLGYNCFLATVNQQHHQAVSVKQG